MPIEVAGHATPERVTPGQGEGALGTAMAQEDDTTTGLCARKTVDNGASASGRVNPADEECM